MKRVCVFAGSSPGARPEYTDAARALGKSLAVRGLGLVYGGGGTGLMGAVADGILAEGGRAIGVIPAPLVERELAHADLSELRVVSTMHERKAMMEDLSDGFIALPGGLGTLDELMEIWTWAQLGIHAKPCGLLNVCGYYDALLDFLDRVVAEEFVEPKHLRMAIVEGDIERLLDRLEAYEPPQVRKWVEESEI